MRFFVISTFYFLFSIFSPSAWAAHIVFKDGKTKDVPVAACTDRYVQTDVAGVAVKYYFDEIATIDSLSPREFFQASGKYAPQYPRSMYLAALGFGAAGDLDQARVSLEEAAKYDTSGLPLALPGRVLADIPKTISRQYGTLLFSGLRDYEAKNVKRALVQFQEAVESNPDYFAGHYFCGSALYSSGDYAGAVASFKQAQGLEHGLDAELSFYLGQAYFAAGDNQNALRSFDQTAVLVPGHRQVYLSMGLVYMALKQPQSAVRYFIQALRIDPQNALAYYYMAECYYQSQDYEKFRENFNKAAKLFEKSGDAAMLAKVSDYLSKIIFEKN